MSAARVQALVLHPEEVPKVRYNDYRICQESRSFHIIKDNCGYCYVAVLMLENLKHIKYKKCQKWTSSQFLQNSASLIYA